MSLLETKNIVKKYGSRTVVDRVSLQVKTGVVVGLLGPNGAGKTTSFYSIAGFIRPNKGNIMLDGEVITNLPIHKRALKGISGDSSKPTTSAACSPPPRISANAIKAARCTNGLALANARRVCAGSPISITA